MAISIRKVYYWIKDFAFIPISLKTLAPISTEKEPHRKSTSRNLFLCNNNQVLYPCAVPCKYQNALYDITTLHSLICASHELESYSFQFHLDVASSMFPWKKRQPLFWIIPLAIPLKWKIKRKFKVRIGNSYQFHKDSR